MKNHQSTLDKELQRLKRLIPQMEVSSVQWAPRQNSRVSGEVIKDTILIYDVAVEDALKTLRHEFLDCLITRNLVNPLISLVNTLIKTRESEIYRTKERVVETLSKLI